MATQTLQNHQKIFESVFPSAKLKDLVPTPAITPQIGFSAAGQSFGGFSTPATPIRGDGGLQSGEYPEQVVWERSWHTATSFLLLPEYAIRAGDNNSALDDLELKLAAQSKETTEAIRYVLSPTSRETASRLGKPENDLYEWYSNQVRRHFSVYTRPLVLQILQSDLDPFNMLDGIGNILEMALNFYSLPYEKSVLPELSPHDAPWFHARFIRDIRAVVRHGLPIEKIFTVLAHVFTNHGSVILSMQTEKIEETATPQGHNRKSSDVDTLMVSDEAQPISFKSNFRECSELNPSNLTVSEPEESESISTSRSMLLTLLQRLQATGLGGGQAQKTFASVLHDLMTQFVQWSYGGAYEGGVDAVQHLRYWIENVFARFVVQVLDILRVSDDPLKQGTSSVVGLEDVRKWQDMAVSRLGVLRVDELFDIIVDWDRSRKGVDDLKHFVTSPATRTYLTTRFVGALSTRLLHSGASTIEILQLYISIIKAFRELDPKGVLLDRVARPVRKYLRERDDTVMVVVRGLMTDVSEGGNESPTRDVLTELAVELNERNIDTRADDEGDLDWNNMEWVPDPVDAAPDYKKSKASDVIGTLISLFESKDTFIKELQVQLAERLLRKSFDFDHEVGVIEHLKLRFGDSNLQACEVMLRDVLDSRRVDNVIRHDQSMDNPQDPQNETQMHAKILSRLFWPIMQEITFTVPPPVAALQARYSTGYEALKQSRKLTWIHSCGYVSMDLEFEDRVFSESVPMWQAAVIYQFDSSDDPSQPSPTKSILDISTAINMAAHYVRSACLFWLSKHVLHSPSLDHYAVLERLPTATSPSSPTRLSPSRAPPIASTAAAEQAAAAAAAEAASQAKIEQMDTYRQFVLAMLTNQGQMPLPTIATMLGWVVQGGFPYSNEELKGFLNRLVAEGVVEMGSGGTYKIAK
ncbi:MAG: hypothetical protein Q9227_004964 [Pyrenula ochraceoflavens]